MQYKHHLNLATPEGLPNYVVPPPAFLDATDHIVLTDDVVAPENEDENEDEPLCDEGGG